MMVETETEEEMIHLSDGIVCRIVYVIHQGEEPEPADTITVETFGKKMEKWESHYVLQSLESEDPKIFKMSVFMPDFGIDPNNTVRFRVFKKGDIIVISDQTSKIRKATVLEVLQARKKALRKQRKKNHE